MIVAITIIILALITAGTIIYIVWMVETDKYKEWIVRSQYEDISNELSKIKQMLIELKEQSNE